MENKTTTAEAAQGATPAKREISKNQTVKSFGQVVSKLRATGLVNEADHKTLLAINEKVVKQYMGFNLEL